MALQCRVRPETPAEIDRITELTRLAFDGEHEVDMIADIRSSDRFVPELSLVAELDGELVGHCLLNRINLTSTTAPACCSWGRSASSHPGSDRGSVDS